MTAAATTEQTGPPLASRAECARWFALVALLSGLLLWATAIVGRFVLVGPVFDPGLFVLDEGVDTLIIGASHAATAIDPRDIEGSVSLGRNGEPMFFTYHKLRTVLERSPGIEHVILALSPSHVSVSQDGLVFAGDGKTREAFMAYFPFLDPDGRSHLDHWSEDYLLASAKYDLGIPLGYMDDARLVVNFWRGRVDLGTYPGWGGFYRVPGGQRLTPEAIDDKLDFYFHDHGEVGDTSALAVEHVRKIVATCRERSIDLTIVTTPLHERFRAGTPAACRADFEALVTELLDRHPQARYFDYSGRFDGDELFHDGDHLNHAGSRRFSREFARALR